MSTYDLIGEMPRELPSRPSLLASFGKALALWRQNFVEYRSLVRLSRLPAYLIRDMGFEPSAIYRALEGTWDEVPGGRWSEQHR